MMKSVCSACDFISRTKLDRLGDMMLIGIGILGAVSFAIWPLFWLWPVLMIILALYGIGYAACRSCKLPES